MKKTIALASDHAGYRMKGIIKEYLEDKGLEIKDLGSFDESTSDYPDFGHPLAEYIENGICDMGISLCGSGNGINMVTNKHQGIRAAICWNEEISVLARKHNDANICSLPARFISDDMAKKIVDLFLETKFEGGRHESRIKKIPSRP